MTRILVIGGGGLLGSRLSKQLVDAGHEVAICDSLVGTKQSLLPKVSRIFTTNVTDYASLSHTFSSFDPEIIYFAASYTSGPDTRYNPVDDVRLQVAGTNALSGLLTNKVKHVFYCSSSEVYGPPQPRRNVKETRNIEVASTQHGAACLAAEALLKYRCAELGIVFTPLRIFDMYGPREVIYARTGIVSFITDYLFRGETVGLVGADRPRDFIHVDDVVTACVLLLDNPINGPVNVGSGKKTTLKQIASFLYTNIEDCPRPVIVPKSKAELYSAIADTSLLRKATGWKPEVVLKDGLLDIVNKHKARRDSVLAERSTNTRRS